MLDAALNSRMQVAAAELQRENDGLEISVASAINTTNDHCHALVRGP